METLIDTGAPVSMVGRDYLPAQLLDEMQPIRDEYITFSGKPITMLETVTMGLTVDGINVTVKMVIPKQSDTKCILGRDTLAILEAHGVSWWKTINYGARINEFLAIQQEKTINTIIEEDESKLDLTGIPDLEQEFKEYMASLPQSGMEELTEIMRTYDRQHNIVMLKGLGQRAYDQQVKINRKTVNAIIDTGSVISIIVENFVNPHN